MAEFSIREMSSEDIKQVMKVDVASFTTPWTYEIYEQEVNHNKHAHYFVIEESENIIGYVGLWIVEEDAQITNIALLPQFRGYKIGEKLFGFAMQYAIQQGANRLSLEVRVSNIVAQKLYIKFGLVPGGIRKGYYPDNGEDALVMWVNLH
ncbi:ribosomal protein S18-alanine N-acetyltransferase [Pseudogracilibacillus sp. SE30717A]|uniref:ribosomal protein S18-alanine N-acetyltransferase n=1 Tax=Pseudogracilibacillus sp. SE30717A TaxID=3098293 RepID=UPI00300DC227